MTQRPQPIAAPAQHQVPSPQQGGMPPPPVHSGHMAPPAHMPSPYGQPAGAIPVPQPPMPPVAHPQQHGYPAAQTAIPNMQPPGGLTQGMPPYQMPTVDPISEGGELALPNIAIQAFCERSETASAIHEMSRDWRMKRTNLKIFMGGLPAAIEYYHKEGTPALILIESGMRGNELFAQLDQLASVCDSGTQLIMIGATNDIKLYRQLLDKGISDYIVPPFHPLSMIRTISEHFSDPEKPFTGRVAAFFGAKGGVGSSTLAHNVAWCLAEGIQQETALIDLDSSWGTTGLDFAYDATQGLEEALAQPDRLDDTLLDRIMLRHTAKLSILPAAGALDSNPVMDPKAYETVVNGIRKISPISIVDMPHYWSEWTRNILTGADDVIITANCDLANLRNTKNLFDYLKAERPNDGLPILILNKTGRSKTHEISVKDFGAAVGIDPSLVIGFDPDSFFEAANDGKMLTEVKSAAATVNGLTYIANRIKTGSFSTELAQVGKKKGSFLSKKSADGGKTSLFSKLKKKKD